MHYLQIEPVTDTNIRFQPKCCRAGCQNSIELRVQLTPDYGPPISWLICREHADHELPGLTALVSIGGISR